MMCSNMAPHSVLFPGAKTTMASHMPCASNRLARRTIVCTARTSKIGDASRSPTRPATRVYAQHTADHPTLQQMVVLTSGVLGTGMLAQPAWAEGLALPQVEGVDQVLVAIGFALAVALLTILTLGVAYLSITSWLDSRAENSDRQLFSVQDADRRYDAAMKSFQDTPNGKGAAPAKRKKVKAAKGKGFGGR